MANNEQKDRKGAHLWHDPNDTSNRSCPELASTNFAVLFDIQQGKKVAKATMSLVKYVVWITDSERK